MAGVVVAGRDPSLVARVMHRQPLLYAAGSDARVDRPAHVRAGSGVALLGGRLAIIQDDASFVALVDLTTKLVDSIPLPAESETERQFGDDRGNKGRKLDLEACVTVTIDGDPSLVAFGSGSSPARERIAVVSAPGGRPARARIVPLPALYAALRGRRDLAGSELNIEGAVVLGDALWLVQRGNGEAKGANVPVNAMVELRLAEVVRSLSDPTAPAARPGSVIQYELGELAGVRLTFTDAAAAPTGAIVFLAAAEASPDTVRDGPVAGSVVGVIAAGRARWAPLVDVAGALLVEKAEGIVLDDTDPQHAFVVLDADDVARPSELCDVRLEGPWW
jgi:hypothetical protein